MAQEDEDTMKLKADKLAERKSLQLKKGKKVTLKKLYLKVVSAFL
jgi:hypothetical protein